MDGIAELLKTTREEAGLDIEEVSKDLEINSVVLLNLEEGKIGAFKDIFTLKEYLLNYSKYLGLDSQKLIDEFNEYLFEYTSKIPVKDIEKTIENMNSEKEEKVSSPYTMANNKKKKTRTIYILVYLLIFILVLLAIYWSVNQITVEKRNAYVVGYRK